MAAQFRFQPIESEKFLLQVLVLERSICAPAKADHCPHPAAISPKVVMASTAPLADGLVAT